VFDLLQGNRSFLPPFSYDCQVVKVLEQAAIARYRNDDPLLSAGSIYNIPFLDSL